MTTEPGDLVLDPTCGSGTTAFVAEKWGRRWITCDTSRVAVTLAKQRLMTASFDYFDLKYPQEGLKGGFIYKTVPHVTLKSIANNPEIDMIYEKMHPAVEQALAGLNAALKKIPPNPPFAKGGTRQDSPSSTPPFAKGGTGGFLFKNGMSPSIFPPIGRKLPAPRSRRSTPPAKLCNAAWTTASPPTPDKKPSTTSHKSPKTNCASLARFRSKLCHSPPCYHSTMQHNPPKPITASPAAVKLPAKPNGATS